MRPFFFITKQFFCVFCTLNDRLFYDLHEDQGLALHFPLQILFWHSVLSKQFQFLNDNPARTQHYAVDFVYSTVDLRLLSTSMGFCTDIALIKSLQWFLICFCWSDEHTANSRFFGYINAPASRQYTTPFHYISGSNRVQMAEHERKHQ